MLQAYLPWPPSRNRNGCRACRARSAHARARARTLSLRAHAHPPRARGPLTPAPLRCPHPNPYGAQAFARRPFHASSDALIGRLAIACVHKSAGAASASTSLPSTLHNPLAFLSAPRLCAVALGASVSWSRAQPTHSTLASSSPAAHVLASPRCAWQRALHAPRPRPTLTLVSALAQVRCRADRPSLPQALGPRVR